MKEASTQKQLITSIRKRHNSFCHTIRTEILENVHLWKESLKKIARDNNQRSLSWNEIILCVTLVATSRIIMSSTQSWLWFSVYKKLKVYVI